MTETIQSRLRAALEEAGLTPNDASLRATGGRNRDLVRRILDGSHQAPRSATLIALAEVLGVAPEWLARGTTAAPAAQAAPAASVPILGTAAGSVLGAMQIGGPIDHVEAPPRLAQIAGIYALYVTGESMSPRYEPGDLVFVHPAKPYRPGDYVVVQTSPRPGQPEAYIKQFVARRNGNIVLKQYNPASTVEIPVDHVVKIHKVMSIAEMFGA